MRASEDKHKIEKVTDLRQLLRLVTQDEPGMIEYVYSTLQVGDVWWVPDSVTGLSKHRHPWVIVRGYTTTQSGIVACLRTTTFTRRDEKLGILTPPGIISGLDREGLIVLRSRRTLDAAEFRNIEYEYIGRLPEEWIEKIHDARRALAAQVRARAR
jgi:mRNA-degrading endonuclease toxin of MazEF toxin-antitoxin module